MSTHILHSSGPTFLDRLADRLARRLAGPTVSFTDPGVTPPGAGAASDPGLDGPGVAAAVSPGSSPGCVGAAHEGLLVGGTGVGFPQARTSTRPGAGRIANNCVFWLDDPTHECLNSYGEPIRPGGDCWHSARQETLRSFARQHPGLAFIVEPARGETTPCVVCHVATVNVDQVCTQCRQAVA